MLVSHLHRIQVSSSIFKTTKKQRRPIYVYNVRFGPKADKSDVILWGELETDALRRNNRCSFLHMRVLGYEMEKVSPSLRTGDRTQLAAIYALLACVYGRGLISHLETIRTWGAICFKHGTADSFLVL